MPVYNRDISDPVSPESGSREVLRRHVEEKIGVLVNPNLDALPSDEVRRLAEALRVHQIELEMQNEELRRAQEDLTISQARYFDLYELAPVGFVKVSEKGLIVEANLRATTMLGTSKKELLKQRLTWWIFPEDQDTYYHHRRKLLATGEQQVCELRLLGRDGTLFWVRLEATLTAADENGATLICITLSDITEYRQAEEVLRTSAVNLIAIFEAAINSILIIDPEGIILTANRKVAASLGKDVADLIGLSIYQLLPPELAAARRQRVKDTVKGGTTVIFEDEHKGRHYRHTIYPVADAKGKVIRLIIIAMDITIQVTAVRVLQQHQEDLERQVRERTADLELALSKLRQEMDEHATTMNLLRCREKEQEKLTEELRESNAGLRGLLKRRDEERDELRDAIMANLKMLVLPSLERLRKSADTEKQRALLQLIEANLAGIVASPGREFLTISHALTRMETQVANCIKQGKNTIEIARLLAISLRTVETHRMNIRKKMRIAGSKITLRKYLLSHS